MSCVVFLYVVQNSDKKYFAGFDAEKGQATFIEDPLFAKKFSNKYDIRLRPDENLIELAFDLCESPVKFSEPFRPQRRKQIKSK